MPTTAEPSADAEWLAIASRASDELARSTHGRKRQVTSRLATQAGMSEGLLRRAIAAHRFLEQLEREGITMPAGLRSAPIGVVDIVSRWAEHDREGAVAAAMAHVSGSITFRELLTREIAARPATVKKRPARMFDVRTAWKDAVLARLPRLADFKNSRIEEVVAGDPPVDGWVVNRTSGVRRGAVVIVGPYENDNDVLRDRTTWALRTMGLVQLIETVWLVVPWAKGAAAYREQLDRWPLRVGRVIVVSLTRPPALADFTGGGPK